MSFNHLIKPFFSAILALGFLTACDRPEQKNVTPELRPVRTMVVQAVDSGQALEFTAVVDAVNRADLAFKISGELVEFLVKQGDVVKQGNIIAKLDDTDLTINLAEAQAHFDKAMADLARANNLLKTQYISASEFDQISASAQSAKAQLASAENNVKYSTLTAPFDGVIAKVYSRNHQEINAKEPVVRLHNLSQIQLSVNIPESIMIRLRKNSVKGHVDATFNAIPEQSFPLIFSEVATIADEHSKTYEVIFTMKSPQGYVILPGMTASVSANLYLGKTAQTSSDESKKIDFYLPSHTVLKDAQGNFVYVVEDQSDGVGKIVKKSVLIGNITGQGIEIYSSATDLDTNIKLALHEGDHVVTAGMSKISSGSLVKFNATNGLVAKLAN